MGKDFRHTVLQSSIYPYCQLAILPVCTYNVVACRISRLIFGLFDDRLRGRAPKGSVVRPPGFVFGGGGGCGAAAGCSKRVATIEWMGESIR